MQLFRSLVMRMASSMAASAQHTGACDRLRVRDARRRVTFLKPGSGCVLLLLMWLLWRQRWPCGEAPFAAHRRGAVPPLIRRLGCRIAG